MDNITAVAASGLRARMQTLEVLANNMANSSSRGYKADREINSLYTASNQQQPHVRQTWTDFAQGVLQPTGNQLDIALAGPGFFTVRGPAGNLYTRNGTLQVSETGQLQGPDGRPLLDRQDQPVRIDPNRAFSITRTGEVRQDEATVAQLAIVEFADPSVLQKTGETYFRNTGDASAAAPAKETELHQGSVEASNAGTSQNAVRLVSVMRQFEMLQKAITIGSEMNRRAMEEVARVHG